MFSKLVNNVTKLVSNDEGEEVIAERAIRKEIEQLPDSRLQASDFSVRKVCHYGMPHEPTAMAFEPLQCTLAVGNIHGMVKIFGVPGVEQAFPERGKGKGVTHLSFAVNRHRLLVVYEDGLLEVIDLLLRKVVGSHRLGERVTVVHKGDPTSNFVYVGTATGRIYIAHITLPSMLALSTYTITYPQCRGLSASHGATDEKFPAVSAIQTNASESMYLLVAFEDGLLVQWNLKGRAVQRQYLPVIDGLTTVSWYGDGQRIVAGYSSGLLLTWRRNSHRAPASKFYIFGAPGGDEAGENRHAIHGIVSAAVNGQEVHRQVAELARC